MLGPQRYQLQSGCTGVLQMDVDLLDQNGLNPLQPPPFLLPRSYEFPFQHSFLTPNLTHQTEGMAEHSHRAVTGKKMMSKALLLNRSGLVEMWLTCLLWGLLTEPWVKKYLLV